MRRPEASAIWSAGYEAGLAEGVRLGADAVNRALERQAAALGRDEFHGADLLLDQDGPRWMMDSCQRARSKP